jgi:Uma2 family endonuclease
MIVIAPQSTATIKIFLNGVTWPTFKALMAEVEEDRDYRITYNADQLLLERIQLDDTSDEGCLILNGVSWSTYKLLMADVGDGRAWRIAYASGVLELRMPLEEHEEPKCLLEDFVIVIVDELGIEARRLGSLTLERKELSCAVEPDSCLYIQNELRVRGRNIRLPEDPPPDLVIESDHTHSSLNKHSIYAALGVPELWRYAKKTLQIYLLVDGQYQLSDKSLAFPFFPMDEVPELIERSKEIGQRAAVRLFRDRIQAVLKN